MKRLFAPFRMVIAVMVVAIFALFGCGGSGGGSNAFNLFATDNLHPGYSGVWVKIFKADAVDSTGAKVNLLNSTDGLTINLRALNDGAARFLLLAPGQLPNGTYTKISFELDKSVTLVAKPSGTVSTANFPALLDSTVVGHSDLTVDLSPNLVVPGTTKVCIDFDLQNWDVSGGIITPVLHKHEGADLDDPSRHDKFEYRGLVSGLAGTAPLQTFSLILKSGGTVNVSTDDTTQIVIDGVATGLANSQKVHVYGAFDPLTNTIAAKIIRAESEFENESSVVGIVSTPNNVAKTFVVTPSCSHGFFPQGETLTVQTTGTTKFRGAHGVQLTETEFYAALATAGANTTVEAEGSFDAGTNTMTAASVHYESESDMGEDEAKGTSSAVDDVAGTFDLTVTEHDGFDLPGGPLHIAVSPTAEYRNKNGQTMTQLEFFTVILANSKTIEVKGSFAGTTLTASRLRFKN